jgi:hypothetical protein
MPVKSKQQLKAMAAAMSGKSNLGIPPSVGKEFVEATPKGAAKKLPTRVGPKKSSKPGKGKDFSFTK